LHETCVPSLQLPQYEFSRRQGHPHDNGAEGDGVGEAGRDAKGGDDDEGVEREGGGEGIGVGGRDVGITALSAMHLAVHLKPEPPHAHLRPFAQCVWLSIKQESAVPALQLPQYAPSFRHG